MSDANPNQEERERIVAAVTNKMMRKDLLPQPPTEIEVILGKSMDAVKAVKAQLQPIIDLEIASGNIHTPKGRAAALNTTHKLFVDQFRWCNREEALFILALIHAEQMLGEFV